MTTLKSIHSIFFELPYLLKYKHEEVTSLDIIYLVSLEKLKMG